MLLPFCSVPTVPCTQSKIFAEHFAGEDKSMFRRDFLRLVLKGQLPSGVLVLCKQPYKIKQSERESEREEGEE